MKCCIITGNKYIIKKKNKKYHSVGTILKSNIKIVGRGKIDTPNKYMTAHYPGLVQALQ